MILLKFFIAYLFIEVIIYVIPLIALIFFNDKEKDQFSVLQKNLFYIVVSCHNAQHCIKGIVKNLKEQKYPDSLYKILILADNCTDGSAAIASSLDVEVFERNDLSKKGKRHALNALLNQKLKYQKFDAVIFLDIDARVKPDFLLKASSYFEKGAQAIQGATNSKNPNETTLTFAGDLIQALLRVHQKGRSLIGLQPLIIGSHGCGLTRDALEKLCWQTNTDQVADDTELGLRCNLRGVYFTYCPDLPVTNDLPSDVHNTRLQHRRWSISSLQLIPQYFLKIISMAIKGKIYFIDILFAVLLLPSFATLFILLGSTTLILFFIAAWFNDLHIYGYLTGLLWLIYILYIFAALKIENQKITIRHFKGIIYYLILKLWILIQAVFLVKLKVYPHTQHGDTH